MKHIVFFLSTGLLLMAPPDTIAQSLLNENLEKHVYTLADDSLKGRSAGSEFSQIAADYIVRQFEIVGIPPFLDDGYFQHFDEKLRNVVGILRGNDAVLKDEYIIVGAHYDHIGFKIINGDTIVYNGADDNASGVAALIELGRILKKNQSVLQRSVILIAFDAEETGLNGSRYFANYSGIPFEKIKLMISADMIGWHKVSGFVKYSGTGTINNGKEAVSDKKLIPEGLTVTTKKFEKSMFTATDTEPFAMKNIPTLAVTTGLKSPYHKPEDDADLIDYDGMSLIVEHLANVVQAVSADKDYRASGKIAAKHQSTQQRLLFGVTGNVGSNSHHYTKGTLTGKTACSYGIGTMLQVNMKAIALRTEVYYDRVQARHPAGKTSTNNITIPLSIVLQSTGSNTYGFDLFAGGYFRHGFGGKQGGNNIDFTDTFYRNEGGLNYGIGLWVSKIKIGYTSRVALTNFTRHANGDNAHIRNRANYFSLTYLF